MILNTNQHVHKNMENFLRRVAEFNAFSVKFERRSYSITVLYTLCISLLQLFIEAI